MLTREMIDERTKYIQYPSMDKNITVNKKELMVMLQIMLEQSTIGSYEWHKEKGAMYINREWHTFNEDVFSGLTQLDFCKQAMYTLSEEGLLDLDSNLELIKQF